MADTWGELTDAAADFGKFAKTNAQSLWKSRSGQEIQKYENNASTDPSLKNRDYAVIIKQTHGSGGQDEVPFRVVVGAVPSSFQMAQNIEWNAPMGAGLLGDSKVADFMAAVKGNRLVGQVMTMQVWQGSRNDFEFTVTFELRAFSDPEKDVMEPLRTLLRMSLPKLDDTGWLKSPGAILEADGVAKLSERLTKVSVAVLEGGAEGIKTTVGMATGQTSASDGLNKYVAIADKTVKQVEDTGILRKKSVEDVLRNKISINIGRWFELNNVVITQVQHDIKGQTPNGDTGAVQAANVTIAFKPMFAITQEDVKTLLKYPNADMCRRPTDKFDAFIGSTDRWRHTQRQNSRSPKVSRSRPSAHASSSRIWMTSMERNFSRRTSK